MNIIDSIAGYISPRWGALRAEWRNTLEAYRGNYDAGADGRLQNQWNIQNLSGEMTDRYDRDRVRARARDLERNSDTMNSVVRAFRRNVIGSGIHIRVTTGDADINETLEKMWKKWCKRFNCDVTGQQSFTQIVRMCIQRKIVDGGILVVKRYTNQGIIPLQLQILEVDELDISQLAPKKKGNRVVGGIEYNRWNRPEGYWIRQYSIDGYTQTEPVYIEAKDVVFYFSKKRPSQIREISDLSPSLTRIKDMNEFMHAVTLKEKIAACLAVFIKRIASIGGPGRGSHKAGPNATYAGKRVVPGMIMELNAGDEAQMLNPAGQGTDATSFIKTLQRMVSSSNGLSYESASRDMSETNYASARQSMIEDDLTYGEEREILVENFLDEIYESFVISCWLKGVIQAADFWENLERYLSHEWVVIPRRWIDPYKEASANSVALKTGQKTFQQSCTENGRDWKQVIDEMADARDYANDRGIDLMAMISGRDPGGSEMEESYGQSADQGKACAEESEGRE